MTIKKASLSKSRHLKVGYQLYESRHSDWCSGLLIPDTDLGENPRRERGV
ncbi:TPA: hypothetical protein ACGSTW_000249 [Pseudomonas aeruginosa]